MVGIAPKEPEVYNELRWNCVLNYEWGLGYRGRGGGSGVHVSVRKMFGLICGNLPKSVPGVLKEVRRAITKVQELWVREDADLVGVIYVCSAPHG